MDFRRQLDIIDPSMIMYPVTLIGCGGIGSPTALVLGKTGCQEFTILDPDIIEAHNLPNQLFPLSDVDRCKVVATRDMVSQFTDCSVRAVPEEFDGSQELSGIVISGVDSMASRQTIWEAVKFNLDVPLYIDGRIGGEIVQVFTVEPSQIEDIELYESSLFPDEEAAELPCTARAVMYVGFVIAGLIASQFKKWINGEQFFRKISFDLKTMTTVLK